MTENGHPSIINTVRKTGFSVCAAVITLAAVFSQTSCVKDDLYNTPHPDKGAVVLVAYWSERTEGVPAPTEYVVRHNCCDNDVQTMDGTAPACYPALFTEGAHSLVAYNTADKINADGLTAVVAASPDGPTGTIVPMPGYLWSTVREITVTKDDTVRVTLPMHLRVRDLHFDLTVTGGDPELIKSVTARLSGIAGSFDLATQKTAGEPTATVVTFTRKGDKLLADARLLGTMGGKQTLVLEVVFTDGGRTQKTEVDMTEALAAFNANMSVGYVVKGYIETPLKAEISAVITGWNEVAGDPAEAV